MQPLPIFPAHPVDVGRRDNQTTIFNGRACGYCAPCPSGVAIPETFSAYNTGAMFNAWKAAAWQYDTFFASQGHGADQCQECGACETKCPQGIPIMEKLKEAHGALVR